MALVRLHWNCCVLLLSHVLVMMFDPVALKLPKIDLNDFPFCKIYYFK